MPCEVKRFGDGTTAIICSRGRRGGHVCGEPGCGRPAGIQCDYPLTVQSPNRRTCDRWLCHLHAKRVGHNRDYCPGHAALDERLAREARERAAGNPGREGGGTP